MKPFQEFIDYLYKEVANGSIYVLGGQGQTLSRITESWLETREHGDTKNIARVKALLESRKKLGYGSTLKAFDCYGLGMYWLQNVKKIFPSDMTANGMCGKCEPIGKDELLPGDWCFVVNNGRATHIAFYVGSGLVVEARGRDYGVVISHLTSRFNAYGRPRIWATDIESQDSELMSDMLKVYDISKKYGGDNSDS